MSSSPRPALFAGAAAVGVVAMATAWSEPAASFAGGSPARSVLEAAAGACLLAAGLRAMAVAGERTAGWLLVLASYGWFLLEFNNPGARPAIFTTGLVLSAVAPPLLAHAVVASSGRLGSRPARAIVAAGYAAMVGVMGLLAAVVFDPRAEGCVQCPRNLLLLVGDPKAHELLLRAGLGSALAWSAAAMALLAARLARSSAARRRTTAPVIGAGWLYLALVAADLAHGLRRGFLSNDAIDRSLWIGQAAALVLLAAAMALAWWRSRRRRFRVARLVLELGAAPPPGGLRDALAAVLGDPSLELAYRLDDGRLVNVHGSPASLAGAVTPLVSGGETVAMLSHRTGRLDDPAMLAEVAATARLALDNERLQAQARADLEALRASRRRVVAAGDAERRRLERDLHDGAQPRLIALSLAIALRSRERPDSRLDEMQAELDSALTELRKLALGVFPALLAGEGLGVALQALSEEAPRPLELTAVTDERFEPAVEMAAYFVVSEAVRAGPASGLSVQARHGAGCLVVELETEEQPANALDIEDRVRAVDGRVLVTERPDGRVRLNAEIPCGS